MRLLSAGRDAALCHRTPSRSASLWSLVWTHHSTSRHRPCLSLYAFGSLTICTGDGHSQVNDVTMLVEGCLSSRQSARVKWKCRAVLGARPAASRTLMRCVSPLRFAFRFVCRFPPSSWSWRFSLRFRQFGSDGGDDFCRIDLVSRSRTREV